MWFIWYSTHVWWELEWGGGGEENKTDNWKGRNYESRTSASIPSVADVLPCLIPLPICLWIMDPHSTVAKKKTSHRNEVLLQDTMHLIQRPCFKQGSLCQDPAGNWTTQRPPETQTEVVRTCPQFNRSGQNHLARHSERGKQTRQTEKEVGRQYQGMDRPGVRQVPEGSGDQRKMEETGCQVICGAPTTPAVKG